MDAGYAIQLRPLLRLRCAEVPRHLRHPSLYIYNQMTDAEGIEDIMKVNVVEL